MRPAAQRQASFVATLALAMTVSTFLQVVFGTLAPFLTADLELSRAQLGTLTTALFLTGALLSPVAGPLVDRFGGRRLLVVLFLVGALSFVWVAAARSYVSLLVAALFGGLAVALGNPVTNPLIAAHTPRARQGVVTGVKQSGVQAGVFIGGAALPPLAQVAGWRVATLTGLVLPVIGLVGTVAAVPSHIALPRAARASRPRLPAHTAWLTTYALGMGLGMSAIGAYLPLYGVERLGMPPSVAGLLAAVVGGVGVAARIAWGRAADRSTTPASRWLAVLGFASVGAGAMLLFAQHRGAWLAWAGAVVVGASAAAWNAVGMLAIVRDAEFAVAGRASGIVLLGFYFGFVVGPPVFGAIVDATTRYALGWAFVLTAFLLSAVVAVLWALRFGETTRTRPAA